MESSTIMNRTGARSLGYVAGLTALLVVGWVLTGQAAKRVKHAEHLPTDWSHRHVVFSHPSTPEEYARVANEPRYWQQIHRRERHSDRDHDEDFERRTRSAFKARLHRDWAVNLGTGATVGAGNYPAKFGLNITQASCSDYAVFGTELPGPGVTTIVGFTNLYSGCAGSPTVNWAYDTGGTILTSPITSIDGTQVAVVQSSGGVGQLVLLKWAALSGTIGAPIPLAPVAPAAYQACTAPCMTTIGLVDNATNPVDDTTSSLFYDYGNDIVWVGGAGGWVHKITGVFNGTPTEVTTGGFPAQVNIAVPPVSTSSAVYDSVSKNVYVGGSDGILYAVNSTTGVVTASSQLDFANGIVDAPIIDQTAGLLYVFVSNDGATIGCPAGLGCAAVFQLSTTFGPGAPGTEAQLGDGDSGGAPNPVWIGGFDSAYFSSASGSRTGNLYVCGSTGAVVPALYQVPITAGVLPAAGTPFVTLGSAASTGCSPVTDIHNPNTTGGASERLFVSVAASGLPSGCVGGCIMSFVDAPWAPNTAYTVGQQVISSAGDVETVVTAAGTSGGAAPAWSGVAGGTTTDGGITWVDQGAMSASTISPWAPNNLYGASSLVLDSNGNVEVSTAGTSGGSTPAWNTAPGGTTTDAGVTWTNAGTVGTFSLPAAGGTSGIIEDNVVSQSTQTGASQIYFSTLNDQTCGTSGIGGCAVQASQPALQ